MAFDLPVNVRILQAFVFVQILQVYVSSTPFNCSLETTIAKVQSDIQTFILAQKELIFLHFQLPNYKEIYSDNGTIYKILDLVWTRGGNGNKLLLMHPNFEQFSIGILKFGVEHVFIPLKAIPRNCIMNSTEKEFEEQILRFASNELNVITNQDNKIRLCNIHVQNEDGNAIFFYSCCFMNASGDFICNKLESNEWMDVLFFAMAVTYVLAFLFTPLLIPTSWYKSKDSNIYSLMILEYHMKVSENKEGPVYVPKGTMKSFTENISKLSSGGSLLLKVNEIQLDIEELRIVTPNHVPAGILHYIYTHFVKCQVKDHQYVQECCEGKVNVCPGLSFSRWDKCLKRAMQGIFLIFLLFPWFIRIIFFYAIEENDRTEREHFANRRNLNYPTVLKWNFTYALKPNHPFFIVCYIAVSFVPFLKSLVRFILHGSSFVKHELNISSATITKTLLIPCKQLGLIGILISPLYWTIVIPFITIIYLPPFVPLLTISITMVGTFSVGIYELTKYNWENGHKARAIYLFPVWMVAGILLFMPIFSSMILCLEVVIFFLQILLYVFIGIIINASLVLTYVTFGGMLMFYAYDSVKNVERKYKIFSSAVIDYFISDVQDSMKGDLLLNKNYDNYCLPINLHGKNSPLNFKYTSTKKSKKLCLLTEHPLLFFDKGEPFISESLFFDMCHIKFVGSPGSVWRNYKQAFANFFVIVLFLMCVAIIILAFGQTTGVPGIYQSIASLGGGLVPLLLRTYFFRSYKPLDFKTDHVLLQAEMKRILKERTWEMHDIVGELIEPDSGKLCDHINVNIPDKVLHPGEVNEEETSS